MPPPLPTAPPDISSVTSPQRDAGADDQLREPEFGADLPKRRPEPPQTGVRAAAL